MSIQSHPLHAFDANYLADAIERALSISLGPFENIVDLGRVLVESTETQPDRWEYPHGGAHWYAQALAKRISNEIALTVVQYRRYACIKALLDEQQAKEQLDAANAAIEFLQLRVGSAKQWVMQRCDRLLMATADVDLVDTNKINDQVDFSEFAAIATEIHKAVDGLSFDLETAA